MSPYQVVLKLNQVQGTLFAEDPSLCIAVSGTPVWTPNGTIARPSDERTLMYRPNLGEFEMRTAY